MPAATSHEEDYHHQTTRAMGLSSASVSHLEDYFMFNDETTAAKAAVVAQFGSGADDEQQPPRQPVSAGNYRSQQPRQAAHLDDQGEQGASKCLSSSYQSLCADHLNGRSNNISHRQCKPADRSCAGKQTSHQQPPSVSKRVNSSSSPKQYLISERQQHQSKDGREAQQIDCGALATKTSTHSRLQRTSSKKSATKKSSLDDLELLGGGARNFNYFLHDHEDDDDGDDENVANYADNEDTIESPIDYYFAGDATAAADCHQLSLYQNQLSFDKQRVARELQAQQQHSNRMEPLMLIYADNNHLPAVIRTGAPTWPSQSNLLVRRRQRESQMQHRRTNTKLRVPLTSSPEFLSSTTPPSQHYLSLEELKQAQTSCWLCGCNWQEYHVSLDCQECGGYALTRPCPSCDGKCKQVWHRNIDATHDRHRALWTGQCLDPQACAKAGSVGFKSSEPSGILGAKLQASHGANAPVGLASSCCSSQPSSAASSDSELDACMSRLRDIDDDDDDDDEKDEHKTTRSNENGSQHSQHLASKSQQLRTTNSNSTPTTPATTTMEATTSSTPAHLFHICN